MANVYTVIGLLALGIIVLVSVVEEVDGVRYHQQFRNKPRLPRGFKTERLSTARGFGKRAPEFVNTDDNMAANGYPEKDHGDSGDGDDDNNDLDFTLKEIYLPKYSSKLYNRQQSFPVDWLVEQIQTDPELALVIIQKFVDTNRDGRITADELISPIATKANVKVYN